MNRGRARRRRPRPTSGRVRAELLLALLLAAACQRAPKTELDHGRGIYARACASCHGIDGKTPALARNFKVPPADLTDPALHARLGEAGIAHAVREGKGQMPSFGKLLSAEDLDALIRYVRSLQAHHR